MNAHDAHDHHVVPYHVVPYRTHIKVWIALLVFTVLTVGLSNFHLGAWSGLIAFSIATAKAALVVGFFMHMKYEGKLLHLMFGIAIVTLVIIFALTFGDYIYR